MRSNISLMDALQLWGQQHIIERIQHQVEKEKDSPILTQLLHFQEWYPGGFDSYMKTATTLFHGQQASTTESSDVTSSDSNPFATWIPSIPQDKHGLLTLESPRYQELESIGLDHIADCAFVVVAGGLGERLGYNGIKLALPIETFTNSSYLQTYIEYILALQLDVFERLRKYVTIPIAIMTSEATHEATEDLLGQYGYFGMPAAQVTLLKQETVPCLMVKPTSPSALQLVLDKDRLVMKPHGHGDVHTLLYSSGLARQWLVQHKKRYVHFFQDTNGLILNSILPLLGATVQNQWHWTYTVIPRKAKDASGAIVEFTPPNTSDVPPVLFNVEYHELDGFLRTHGFSNGDVNDPQTSYSFFPGNINHFVAELPTYVEILEQTEGKTFEIFNPKGFKTPARLECMMQDFPKLLAGTHSSPSIGFVSFPSSLVYSPCKNEATSAASKLDEGIPPQCASTAEHDLFAINLAKLRHVGVQITSSEEYQGVRGNRDKWLGIPVQCRGPHVVWSPTFGGISLSALQQRFPTPSQVFLSTRSTLIIQGEGHVTIHSLVLDGALWIQTVERVEVTIRKLRVVNDSLCYVEKNNMRGYFFSPVVEENCKLFTFVRPGQYTIEIE